MKDLQPQSRIYLNNPTTQEKKNQCIIELRVLRELPRDNRNEYEDSVLRMILGVGLPYVDTNKIKDNELAREIILTYGYTFVGIISFPADTINETEIQQCLYLYRKQPISASVNRFNEITMTLIPLR